MRSDRRRLLDPLHLGAGDVEGFITAFVNNLVQLLEPDLVSWLQRLLWMIRVLGDYDACARIAYENVEHAAGAGRGPRREPDPPGPGQRPGDRFSDLRGAQPAARRRPWLTESATP